VVVEVEIPLGHKQLLAVLAVVVQTGPPAVDWVVLARLTKVTRVVTEQVQTPAVVAVAVLGKLAQTAQLLAGVTAVTVLARQLQDHQ
jgi:hypothetical protein